VSSRPPVLWQYSFSNYNEKVRWALDFKGIRHSRRSLLPMSPRSLWFSRGGGTVPALDLDGERIADSTQIIAALESRQPEPALYPSDEQERARALALEDYFDEHAGHEMRRVVFWEQRDETRYGAALLTTDQLPGIRLLLRSLEPLAKPALWSWASRRYGWNEEAFERSKRTLVIALDRIESERNGRPHLVADRFSVADLTAAALLYPLVWPPEYQYELPEPPPSEFRESVRDHPAVGWIAETWRRHRGALAAV
jgi:glutathione S-transferase